MFKRYCILGIVLILFTEVNFFLKIQPFANFYFPIVWIGYILLVDAVVYKIKGNSLITNRTYQFLGIILISALFWWIFEFANLSVNNWSYEGLIESSTLRSLFGTISFATVLPALFETVELIRTIHLFDKIRLKKNHKITKHFLHAMVGIGVLCFILPFAIPNFAFPLVWLSFFL